MSYSAALGQQTVVENVGGARGTLGVIAVTRAAPDGYTLLLGQTSPVTLNPALSKNVSFDPL